MKPRLNQISTSKISKVISEVKEIWEVLNQEYIDNCIESMPSRLQECMNNESNWINYFFLFQFKIDNQFYQNFVKFLSYPVPKIINAYFILNARTTENCLTIIYLAALLTYIIIFIQICEDLREKSFYKNNIKLKG